MTCVLALEDDARVGTGGKLMLDGAVRWVRAYTIGKQGVMANSAERVCHVESTGLLIPSLVAVGSLDLAAQYARWLAFIQRPDGSFGSSPAEVSHRDVTAHVIRGWVAAFPHVPGLDQALRRACDWLLASAESSLTVHDRWPLEQAGQLLGESRYSAAAREGLAGLESDDGARNNVTGPWVADECIRRQAAWLELGSADRARSGLEWLEAIQRDDGAVPAAHDSAWVNLSALALLARLWYQLGERDRADRAMGFIARHQSASGGFPGGVGPVAEPLAAEETAITAGRVIDACAAALATRWPQDRREGAPAVSHRRKLRIVYYANCWMTNLGEAFIDIGAEQLLKQAMPESEVILLTPMSFHYNNALRRAAKSPMSKAACDSRTAHLGRYMDADVFVMSGMYATEEFLSIGSAKHWVNPFLEAHPQTKVLFMGVGGEQYTEQEVAAFSGYVRDKINLAGFISRDDEVYGFYRDRVPDCYAGMDCAYFCGDVYAPTGFAKNDYVVSTFHSSPEPNDLSTLGCDIIRPEHMFYTAKFQPERQNTFISDTPHEYLSLYANARAVFTDLVHATIISLTYDVPVLYFGKSKRSQAFAASGATWNADGFLASPREEFARRKARMLETVRKLLDRV